jgi:hypothetical protein
MATPSGCQLRTIDIIPGRTSPITAWTTSAGVGHARYSAFDRCGTLAERLEPGHRRSSTGHGVAEAKFDRAWRRHANRNFAASPAVTTHKREKPAGSAFVLLRTLGGPNGPSMTPRTSRWRRPLQRPSLETPFRPSRDESISVLDDSPVLQGSDGCSKRRRFAFRHLRSRCSSSVVAAAFVTFTLAGWPSRLSESVPPERMLFGHRALERPS